ncbi:hypothetical protein CDAR_60171 [Caerostris darwini]|uniref:Uncharacterized protein n=1 Tax=Caerostris darwini TaxID=1538125 RepID=A0AAV4QQA2_9ARAC|nr:hypothetical protein CDAR_60171 [Caerostris darwini]
MDDRAPRYVQGGIHGDGRGGAFQEHGIECSNGSTRSSPKSNKVSTTARFISLETQNHEIKTNKSRALSRHFSTENPSDPSRLRLFSLFDILSETPSTFHYRYSDALTPPPPPKESKPPSRSKTVDDRAPRFIQRLTDSWGWGRKGPSRTTESNVRIEVSEVH